MRNIPLSPSTPGAVPLGDLDALPSRRETLGERLARLRKLRGLTQADLADNLGVSMTSVCYWEQDRSRPKRARIQALADALGTPVDALLDPPAIEQQSLQDLVTRMRAEIADAAGTTPAKVKIVIEM